MTAHSGVCGSSIGGQRRLVPTHFSKSRALLLGNEAATSRLVVIETLADTMYKFGKVFLASLYKNPQICNYTYFTNQ